MAKKVKFEGTLQYESGPIVTFCFKTHSYRLMQDDFIIVFEKHYKQQPGQVLHVKFKSPSSMKFDLPATTDIGVSLAGKLIQGTVEHRIRANLHEAVTEYGKWLSGASDTAWETLLRVDETLTANAKDRARSLQQLVSVHEELADLNRQCNEQGWESPPT